MSNSKTQTAATNVCGSCKEAISEKAVTVFDNTWHPEHFVCTHCKELIGSGKFFDREGKPYCEKDHVSLFSEKCNHCDEPILGEAVDAMDKIWDAEHFVCTKCGASLKSYTKHDGKPFCNSECIKMFEPKCGGCDGAILEKHIPAVNKLWHPECFVCNECSTPLEIDKFFGQLGRVYCEAHKQPWVCEYPMLDQIYMVYYIPRLSGLFICTSCLKQLYEGEVKVYREKPYCQGCFNSLPSCWLF